MVEARGLVGVSSAVPRRALNIETGMAWCLAVYGFLILAVGRAAALVKIEFFGVPVYLTEIVLTACLPLAARGLTRMWNAGHRRILWLWAGFYGIVWAWGIHAVFHPRGPLIVRDVVFFYYPWMFFAAFAAADRLFPRRRDILFAGFVWANAFMILLGLTKAGWPLPRMGTLASSVKTMNIGLTCGMGMVFWLIAALQRRSLRWRVMCVLWASFNMVVIAFTASRTLWAASFVGLFGLMWLFNKRIGGAVAGSLILAGLIFPVLYHTLSHYGSSQIRWMHEKMAAVRMLSSSIVFPADRGKTVGAAAMSGSGGGRSGRAGSPVGSDPIQSGERQPTDNPPDGIKPSPVALSRQSAARVPERPASPGPHRQIKTTIAVPDRIKSLMGLTAVDNIVWRLDVWHQFVQAGLTHPWFGNGIGALPRLILWGDIIWVKGYFADSGIVPAHNMWITVFYKFGLFGTAALAGFVTAVFVTAHRRWRSLEKGLWKDSFAGGIVCLMYWLTAAMFFDMVDSPPTSVFFWILAAFLVRLACGADAKGAACFQR